MREVNFEAANKMKLLRAIAACPRNASDEDIKRMYIKMGGLVANDVVMPVEEVTTVDVSVENSAEEETITLTKEDLKENPILEKAGLKEGDVGVAVEKPKRKTLKSVLKKVTKKVSKKK